MHKMPRILLRLLLPVAVLGALVLLVINLLNRPTEFKNARIKVVATNFPSYDAVRAVIKDVKGVGAKMLLKPGTESHTFEPTPQDILDIKNSNLFVYVGGESDTWAEKILQEVDSSKTQVVKLVDLAQELKHEKIVEGMEHSHKGHNHDESKEEHGHTESDHDHDDHDHDDDDHEHEQEHSHDHKHNHDNHEHEDEEDEDHGHEHEHEEYDEHVWTDPTNFAVFVEKIKERLSKIDAENAKKYTENATRYVESLNKLDREFAELVQNAKRREIIVGDRFPLRYFADRYNLSYYAAFPGCAEQTEASAKTVSFLIKKAKVDQIPVIFHIELSNHKIADVVAKEAGAKVLEFHSAHNLTQKDFEAGVTYVDLMKQNLKNLKVALN